MPKINELEGGKAIPEEFWNKLMQQLKAEPFSNFTTMPTPPDHPNTRCMPGGFKHSEKPLILRCDRGQHTFIATAVRVNFPTKNETKPVPAAECFGDFICTKCDRKFDSHPLEFLDAIDIQAEATQSAAGALPEAFHKALNLIDAMTPDPETLSWSNPSSWGRFDDIDATAFGDATKKTILGRPILFSTDGDKKP